MGIGLPILGGKDSIAPQAPKPESPQTKQMQHQYEQMMNAMNQQMYDVMGMKPFKLEPEDPVRLAVKNAHRKILLHKMYRQMLAKASKEWEAVK